MNRAYNIYYNFGSGEEGPTPILASNPEIAIQYLSKNGYQMQDYVTRVVELVEAQE
jgi:hypothetical protein